MATENPVPEMSAPPAPPAAPTSMMARLGPNGQLVIAGGAVVAVANVLGVIVEDWPIDLRFWLVVLGSLAAIAITFTRTAAVAGIPGGSWVRIDAAIVGAYGLVDLGDTLTSLNNWSALTIILTLAEVVGAAVLAYGAWRASGGSLTADAAGARKLISLGMTDRFVYLGATGLIVSWFLLMAIADRYSWNLRPQIAVLIGVLVLVGRWLDRNPEAGRLPVSYSWLVVGLGAIAVVLGLWWVIDLIGPTIDDGSVGVYVPFLIYLVALTSLGLGAFLSLGKAAPPKS